MTDTKAPIFMARAASAIILIAALVMGVQPASANTVLITSQTISAPNRATLAEAGDSSSQANVAIEQKPASNGGGKSILVLDASGNMWGEIDGRDKISINGPGKPH